MPSEKQHKLLLSKTNETQSGICDIEPYKLGYFIAQNKEGIKSNEDALFLYSKDNNLIFGVSDGAGGHPKGDEASHTAVNTIVDKYQKSSSPNLTEILEQVNDAVLNLKVGAHCTLSAVHIQKDIFRAHSIGDSEVIYWNSQGNKLYNNIPHSEVGYLIQSGVIKQKESLDNPNRYLVTNLVGDSGIRIESASKMEIKKGHSILVGSDGLFDNISHDDLADILTQGSFEDSYEKLKDMCLNQNEKKWKKDDDISFIFLRKVNFTE